MSTAERSLGQTATWGVAWLMAQSVSVRALTMASQIVLGWLLSPAQFGAVGLASTVGALAAVVANLGIDEVLVQRRRSIARWSRPAFWLSLGLACSAMMALLFAAPAIATAFHIPILSGLISVAALSLPLTALSTVPMVLARANLRFKLLAVYNGAELGALQVLVIVLAWAGYGAYSFVLPLPVLALVKAVVFWRWWPGTVAKRPRAGQFSYLIVNGLTVFGSRIVSEAVAQGDYVLLGLMASDAVVGVYFFAFRLAAQPVRMLANNFVAVMFPVLTQIGDDLERQTASAIHAGRLLAYVAIPLCFMQAALAGPGLTLVFGSRWSGAIVLVQILSLGLALDAPAWMAGALMNARGEFKRALLIRSVFSLLFFSAVYVGAVADDARGVAIGVAMYYAVATPVYSLVVYGITVEPLQFLGEVYGMPALLAGASVGLAFILSLVPILADWNLVRCLLIAGLGAVLYLGLLWLLQPTIVAEIAQRVRLPRLAAAARARRRVGGLSKTI